MRTKIKMTSPFFFRYRLYRQSVISYQLSITIKTFFLSFPIHKTPFYYTYVVSYNLSCLHNSRKIFGFASNLLCLLNSRKIFGLYHLFCLHNSRKILGFYNIFCLRNSRKLFCLQILPKFIISL